MADFDEPFGSTIFCDDIRYEIHGKMNYVGVYNGAMYVPSFPHTLAKFGFAITLYEPKDLGIARKEKIPLLMYLPGAPGGPPVTIGEFAAPNADIAAIFQNDKLPSDPDSPPMLRMNLHHMRSGMVLAGPGRLKIRADYNGVKIKLGSIRVELQTQPTKAAP